MQPVPITTNKNVKFTAILTKMTCLLIDFLYFVIHKSILPTSHMGSRQVTFYSFLTIQSYARHLNILTNRTIAMSMCTVLTPQNLVGSSLITLLKIWPLTYMLDDNVLLKISSELIGWLRSSSPKSFLLIGWFWDISTKLVLKEFYVH
jgi:hypothetical protein